MGSLNVPLSLTLSLQARGEGKPMILAIAIGNEPIGHICKDFSPDDNEEQDGDGETEQIPQVKTRAVPDIQPRA